MELDDAAETFTCWVASDLYKEGPISNSPFSSTYGLLTIDGIPKAAATAFRFLERLRGPSLGLEQLTWQAIGSPVDLSPGKAFLGDFFTDCAHGPMGESCAGQIPAKYFTVPDSNGAMRARADK